ncbi:hypothetical protein UFOVP421_42 [uncultured Caudovirales phage]|uniref:Uncharacterized protein n=1 Tax=uncultured Caudovirales phage TaxID=2100421 RepID=A0A6J5M723_9CAUD|nr:hypothetical protein UFOVP421_42 [uncultured Caudovirales phage]
MANVKISDLPAAASAGGTDQLETNQGGTSRRLTVAQVATHVRSTATDTVVVAAGSASAPSIAPTGDSNTGIFFPAADTIAFSEGGVEALRLDSSGNATFAGTVAMASSFLRNRIINGDMRIDQRNGGASVTATDAGYQLDRWQTFSGAASKFTVQQNAGSVTPPAGFTNYLGVTSSSAYTAAAGEAFSVNQNIEGFNVSDFAFGSANARSITLSFWVRSSLTGTFSAAIRNSAANRSYPFTYSVPSANTWTQISVTIPGDTSGTWLTTNGIGLALTFDLGSGANFRGTAGAWNSNFNTGATGSVSVVGTNGATFYLTGVQLEVGTAATPFERRLYGQELALCQRYFQIVDTVMGAVTGSGTTNTYRAKLSVTMRATPTVSIVSSQNINTTGATVVANGNEHFQHSSVGSAGGGFISEAIGRFSAEL